MTARFDIAVLGGGPAGLAAASLAARAGAQTVLLDEGVDDRDAWRAGLAGSGAVAMWRTIVWGLGGGPLVAPGGSAEAFRLDLLTAGAVSTLRARALIVCAGAQERVIPFPGWTLPGVIGLTEAAMLLQREGALPGRQFVIAGSGPLLATVAAAVIARGASVAAIVAAKPNVPSGGAAAMAQIVGAGVPVLDGHRIARVLGGDDGIAAVEVVGLDGGAPRRIGCDLLCVGHGLVPATEITRLFRAAHRFEPARGGWVPVIDAWQRSSVERLYVAGDSAGIAGADAATQSGRLAAQAALRDLGRMPPEHEAAAAPERRVCCHPDPAMADALPALLAAIPADCVVCRCEGVTRAQIEAAADAGARDLNQMKQFTRCGMGTCQGRICGEAAAELLAGRVGDGDRTRVGCFTSRLPLRPLPLRDVLGDFDYADIPIPAPAPI
jgi:pyruvate/2-oxoglutarate dehydrogenase complex dihydrolipoamide dehydrogenase (E3) component